MAFTAGVRAVLPANIATGAWGLVTGIAMVKSGLTTGQALGMTLLVFAGTAQLSALPLIVAQAPLWVILLTALVVNLRFVIFSAGLHPYFSRLPLARRLSLGYLTGDVSFAIFVSRTVARDSARAGRRPRPPMARTAVGREAFFLGMAVPTWLIWQAMSITGIVLATQVPESWGLSFAGIVALIALTVPMVAGWPTTLAALVAAVVSVVAADAPLKLGLLAAVLAGIVVAMAAESLAPARTGAGARR